MQIGQGKKKRNNLVEGFRKTLPLSIHNGSVNAKQLTNSQYDKTI